MMTAEMPASTDAQSLTERYVWAAVRTVPGDQRDELALEIRERIGDAVQALIDAGEPREAAERAALAELGDPERLAATYLDRPLYLIGPRYYLDWLRLLKLLLFTVLPIVIAVIAASTLVSYGNGSGTLGGVFGAVFGGGLTVAVHMVFWTTLVFWIIEWKERREGAGTGPLSPWRPEHLPPVPARRPRSRTDLVTSVVWQVVLGGVWIFLATSWALPGVGEHVSLFDPDRWRPWLPWFLAVVVAEIAFEVVLYRRGWSRPLAAANTLLQVAFAVPAVWLLLNGLLNPAFFDRVGWPEGADSNGPVATTAWVVIVVVALSDVTQGFMKTYRREQSSGF